MSSRREKIAIILTALNSVLLVILLSNTFKNLDNPSSHFSISASEKPESTIVKTVSGAEVTFHNGGWSPKGSCWCSIDNYCMCTPSLAIDLVILDGDNDDRVWVVRRKDTNQMALMVGLTSSIYLNFLFHHFHYKENPLLMHFFVTNVNGIILNREDFLKWVNRRNKQ